MRKYICILLITVLAILPLGIFANTSKITDLKLEQAIKMLQEKNIELALMDKEIVLLERQYKDVLSDATNAIDKYSSNETQNLEYKKTERLYPKQRELEIKNLKNSRKAKLAALELNLKKEYANITSLMADEADMRTEISNLAKKVEQTQLKFNLGQVSERDIKLLQVQKLQLESQLNSIVKSINVALINLKKTIGIPQATNLTISPLQLAPVYLNESEIETKISQFVENNSTIEKIKKEIEMLELEKKIIQDFTLYSQYKNLKPVERSLSEKQNELESTKLELEANTWIEYINISSMKSNIEIERINLDIEKMNYSKIQTQYKAGTINAVTESNARISLNRQENKLKSVLNDYYLAIEEFELNLANN